MPRLDDSVSFPPYGTSFGPPWLSSGSAEALAASSRGQFLAQHSQDLVFELDEEGNYRFVSLNFETVLGYVPSETVGQNGLKIVHLDDRVAFEKASNHISFRLLTQSGLYQRFEGAIADFGNGKLVICRDVSRRENLEDELAALLCVASELNVESGLDELLERVGVRLKDFLPFNSLFVSFVEGQTPEQQVLRQIAPDPARSLIFKPLHRAHFPKHPIWAVMSEGTIWSENDISPIRSDANPSRGQGRNSKQVRAFINVPLLLPSGALGILHLDSIEPRDWNDHHLRVARLVGEQLAAVVQSAYLARARRAQEEQLAQSNALLRATQEAAAEGICLVNDNGELVSYNRRFAALWNLHGEEETRLLASGELMGYVLAQIADPDEFISKIAELFEARDASARDEIGLVDGRTIERYSAPALGEDGRYFGRVWTFCDITERKKTEQQLAHQAYHDAVTGLPNRVLFADHLKRALAKIERSGRQLAVLFLDLDRFKVVNDSLGHEKGDQLLIQVADRIRQSLRPGDVAARFGGDEFMVLLEDVKGVVDATRVADRIAAHLTAPFSLEGHEVGVTTSIGIVLSNSSLDAPEDLLRKADVAMYRAKHNGKAQYEVFSEDISGQTLERLQLELDLTGAIKRAELDVYYQPLVDLQTGRILTFEALVRWNHPTRGLVSPAQFVPLAEETGQIVAVGAFVLRVACAQAKKWTDLRGEPVVIHVNLSVRQFEQADLVSEIERVLREVGLNASQLMLEITESAVMTDAKNAQVQLEHLKKLGVQISIDDFGTGHSSLSYLELFPLDLLKIDRAFVARLAQGTTIVRAVTSLGLALGLEVAAEGIETREQMAALREMGVRWGQGYLISRPVPASQAEELLSQNFELTR